MNVPTHRPLPTWRIARWSAVVLLMLLPWVLTQVRGSFGWDLADFVVFGAMLVTACGAYEVVAHLTAHRRNRWLAGGAIVVVFLLVWVELAVGIFH